MSSEQVVSCSWLCDHCIVLGKAFMIEINTIASHMRTCFACLGVSYDKPDMSHGGGDMDLGQFSVVGKHEAGFGIFHFLRQSTRSCINSRARLVVVSFASDRLSVTRSSCLPYNILGRSAKTSISEAESASRVHQVSFHLAEDRVVGRFWCIAANVTNALAIATCLREAAS